MTAINQLSSISSISAADQLPVYSASNGDARKASMQAIKDFVLDGTGETEGILGISSLFALRITSSSVVALTTDYAAFANYDASLITPTGRDSLSISTVLGEFVANRDISHVMMYCTLVGSWPANRDLSLAVLIGTDAAPYESSFKFVGAGQGVGDPSTASFSGPGANLNNGGNIIRAGEKIKLVAKFNVADNLNLDRLAFVIQTLDGI